MHKISSNLCDSLKFNKMAVFISPNHYIGPCNIVFRKKHRIPGAKHNLINSQAPSDIMTN